MPSNVDTRLKIMAAHAVQAASFGDAQFVLVYLDPLTQAHAARLEQVATAGPLVAVVLDPPAPLLRPQARAELAASLACVQAVVTGAGEEWLASIAPLRLIDERNADIARRQGLMQHVTARHALA
ncbi:MAG: hypothetical protein FJW31_22080 [Acidobacteria bacterium]|nr:hypothetical protein [Acidobacteriota bacterium]